MTTLDAVLDVARRNFEEAHASLDADLAVAGTPAEARLVRENRERALAAYTDLIGREMERFSDDWNALAGRAVNAAAALRAATERAAGHPERLRLMADVTASLGDIVKGFG
ncbi:hypothetical protein [Sphingomonas sp. Leaf62]|uniref:hypothetical protein n=1 Tax=Sphingomonas sp. Leaf62 TaxID=1736228 RepID=UPI0006FE70CD|nr:hypothetical protein [Sphingomonas sp. Leaf62]KQN74690.1 hypothetical protein ASE91_17205 [Sphingomonas sp. Leaf62]